MSAKKRKTSWNEKYPTEFGFLKKVDKDESKAFCTICSTEFSIASGGRSDIMKHIETKNHKSSVAAGSSSQKVSDFFKRIEGSNEDLIIAAKESALAYHAAKHNISFRSNDCSSNIIRHFFDRKFSLGRTKTAAIITKVIAPFIDNKILKGMDIISFASIQTDASNHKNIKMLPVVLRCFDPTQGIINWKITITSIPNDQSSTVCNTIMDVIQKNNLCDMIVAYSADNTNMNFGGVQRNGQNNVWKKLQRDLGRNIVGNGCCAHIAPNASSAGCEILEVDLEAIIVKLYKHFSIYSVRTESFKSLCEEMEQIYMPLLNHSSTRFLSLEPAVRRLIKLFEPLMEYFGTLKSCPVSIQNFFNDPTSKFWILFICNNLKLFNESIRAMESSNITSFEVANHMKILKEKFVNRKNFGFLPHESKKEYDKFSFKHQNRVKEKVSEFYATILDYLKLWEGALDGSDVFMWMLMFKYPSWEEIDLSISYAADKYGDKFYDIINRDVLFDEYGLMRNFIEDNISSWMDAKLTPENIWIKIFTNFRERSTSLVNMEKLVQFAFCLAGTSTECERIFSLMNNVWDDHKSRLNIDTMNAILSIQFNSKMSCLDFFDMIKKDTKFLNNVISEEKYLN